jgi:RimJ/RimL family protein N-acetyltransferase
VNLSFRRFQREDYPEYAAWFVDPELNREMGPMDEEWLNAILAEQEEEGITWAVFRDGEFVAVVETKFDPEKVLPAAITALAVKPSLRRQGIAKATLQKVLTDHRLKGLGSHICYIHQDNAASRLLCADAGFVAVSEPNLHGYIEYRHCQESGI